MLQILVGITPLLAGVLLLYLHDHLLPLSIAVVAMIALFIGVTP